jgi:tRNA G37 N-methylase TrmD
MQAGRSTINDIFNQNKVLEIPFFQRAYVWNTYNTPQIQTKVGSKLS